MKASVKEVLIRLASALVLGAAVLFITYWNPYSFDLLCLFGAALLAREWWDLTKRRSFWFVPAGALYIGAATGSLILLRTLDMMFIFALFAMVWSGDIAAYVVGKLIGRHKLAPKISPGKSWEGLIASILATTAIVYFLGEIQPWWGAVIIGFIVGIVGLAGDLFESSLKRHAGVKDTRQLIPGHGGLFDRVDSLMAVAIVMATAIKLMMLYPIGVSQ